MYVHLLCTYVTRGYLRLIEQQAKIRVIEAPLFFFFFFSELFDVVGADDRHPLRMIYRRHAKRLKKRLKNPRSDRYTNSAEVG